MRGPYPSPDAGFIQAHPHCSGRLRLAAGERNSPRKLQGRGCSEGYSNYRAHCRKQAFTIAAKRIGFSDAGHPQTCAQWIQAALGLRRVRKRVRCGIRQNAAAQYAPPPLLVDRKPHFRPPDHSITVEPASLGRVRRHTPGQGTLSLPGQPVVKVRLGKGTALSRAASSLKSVRLWPLRDGSVATSSFGHRL